MNGDNYMAEMVIKRKSNQSTTAFLITSDEMRVRDTIAMLWGKESDKEAGIFGKESDKESVYVYDAWKGLSKVKGVDKEGRINYGMVAEQSQGNDPFSAMMGQGKKGIPDIDRILRSEKAVVILTNVRLEKPHQPDTLDMALESWTQDSEIYDKQSTVIVFTHSPSLFAQKTIDNSIMVRIAPSTADERRNIVRKIKNDYMSVKRCRKLAEMTDNEIDVFTTSTGGLNKAQTESALLESVFRHGTFDLTTITAIKSDMINKKSVLTVHKTKTGFEGIGGYDALKVFFHSRIINVVKNRAQAEKLGLKYPRGYILFGMAGTGKTVMAKALAKEIDMPFVELNLKNIKRSLVGQSEQRLDDALKTIDAMSPCVVFIDEIDRLGSRGGRSGELDGGTSKEIFSELLSWLADENRQSIVIGTTNRPQDLDDAMRRVGRFDGLVPMLLPNQEARVGILKVHTSVKSKIPLADDVDMDEVAKICKSFNGAECEAVTQRASFIAFDAKSDKVTQAHIVQAVKTFIVNKDEREKQLRDYLALAKNYTNDAQFFAEAEASDEGNTASGKPKLVMED